MIRLYIISQDLIVDVIIAEDDGRTQAIGCVLVLINPIKSFILLLWWINILLKLLPLINIKWMEVRTVFILAVLHVRTSVFLEDMRMINILHSAMTVLTFLKEFALTMHVVSCVTLLFPHPIWALIGLVN